MTKFPLKLQTPILLYGSARAMYMNLATALSTSQKMTGSWAGS
jgi:hypothetical protein